MSHNVFTTPNYGDRRSSEVYDEKAAVDMIDRVETANTTPGLTRAEAPELVRNMSPEERAHAEKVLVRKIDFRLMPMLVLMYILNYLDRNNIASARLAGLETDLALTSSQYETSVSILFVGYLLMQSKSGHHDFTEFHSDGTSPFQSFPQQNRQTCFVSPSSDVCLGCHLNLHSCRPKLRWTCSSQICAR